MVPLPDRIGRIAYPCPSAQGPPSPARPLPTMIPYLAATLLAVAGADRGPCHEGHLPTTEPGLQSLTGCTASSFAQDRHGRVAWFDGSYEAGLAKARAEDRVVMLYFFADNARCRELDREAFCDDRTVAALEPAVCIPIDVDSEAGRMLASGFPTEDYYPALVFLDPDGELRDRIIGYVEKGKMRSEVDRILRDEDTLGDRRRRVAAQPDDVMALWDLAELLDWFDLETEYAQVVARLHELDPAGKTLPLRTLSMRATMKACTPENDYAPLRAFLAEETYSELLFDGWMRIAMYEGMQCKNAKVAGDKEAADARRIAAFRARFTAWPHSPERYAAGIGNNIAWDVYLDWPKLPADLHQEAIRVARAASEAKPESAEILDTLACLLFSDGQVDEAVRLMRECIRLEPDRALWEDRLVMFEKEEA